LVGGDVLHFAGGGAGGDQRDVTFAAAFFRHTPRTARPFLRKPDRRAGWFDRVTIQPVFTLGGGVFHGVENCLVVVCPYHRSNSFRMIGELLSSPQILHRQRVLPEAGVIRRVREQISSSLTL